MSTYTHEYSTTSKPHLKSGFTFVELIIALAILAVLAVVIVPNLVRYLSQAKETKTEETINTLKLTINSYYADTNKYPGTLTDLIRKPADVKKYRGPYLELSEVPNDGWDNTFVYKPTPRGAHPYELYSYGPKGPGSEPSEWISAWK